MENLNEIAERIASIGTPAFGDAFLATVGKGGRKEWHTLRSKALVLFLGVINEQTEVGQARIADAPLGGLDNWPRGRVFKDFEPDIA